MKCEICGGRIYANFGDVNSILCKDCSGTEEAQKLLESKKAGVAKQKSYNSEKSNLRTSKIEKQPEYIALIIISGFYKIIAVIVAILALVTLIYGFSLVGEASSSKSSGITLIIYSLFSGLFGVISFLAISEIIKLFIDLESNSRKQIILLKKILDKN